jgi:hypothetical protein
MSSQKGRKQPQSPAAVRAQTHEGIGQGFRHGSEMQSQIWVPAKADVLRLDNTGAVHVTAAPVPIRLRASRRSTPR